MRPRDTKPMGYAERLFWFFLFCLAAVLAFFAFALLSSNIWDSIKGYFTYLPAIVEVVCLA